MKFIVRDTDYAVRALIFMAKRAIKNKKAVITVDDIVRDEKLPERFLRRILQKLAKNKILASYKGKDGGFSFAKSPGSITIVDAIEVFQGKVDITSCLLKGSTCPNVKKCSLRKKLKGIGVLLNREFEKITITSLL